MDWQAQHAQQERAVGPEPQFLFGPFRFDPQQRRLWRGKREVRLQSRPLAVLQYLLTHPERVVTKEELLTQVWAGAYVTTTALRVCVRAIRRALGEEATTPQYLETVGRVGYRWIVPPTLVQPRQATPSPERRSRLQPPPPSQSFTSPIVGRKTELQQLHAWLEQALWGRRQIVFIRGELGIGKTTVVDAFLASLERQAAGNGRGPAQGRRVKPLSPEARFLSLIPWIGRGQCVEH